MSAHTTTLWDETPGATLDTTTVPPSGHPAVVRDTAYAAWADGRVVPWRITTALDAAGLYGPDVDTACGVTEPAVDLWEQGVLYPTWEQLQALAALTGHAPGFFTRGPMPEPGGLLFLCSRSRPSTSQVIDLDDGHRVLEFTPDAVAATLHGHDHTATTTAHVTADHATTTAKGTTR